MLTDNELVRTTLVSGEPELGKAFLFEAAISWAKEGQQIHYFTSKQIESLPPAFHDRSEPSANALKNITFIYTPSYEELIGQLVRLQTFQKPPSILLVDELDVFSDYRNIGSSSRELHAARCCAVLLNAAQSCARVTCPPVHVCVTSFSKDQARRATYGKYFDNCWNISSEEAESETPGSVWMRRGDGQKAMEFKRLDDAVLVLKRVFSCQC
ncbi:hypothetical protein TSAR_012216 [Trichomalopsis sarcophagae]|uniref:ATPase AAA-type core domain-containing protein n=1 Tax=Trichomalopsis sarcophagae TaxID=543379 RepID=A0A232F030_9HYME|nr:hypothetical protein TSAR_012216 [Trichomalopsis sarcophagae]